MKTSNKKLKYDFGNFIENNSFPCLMAKSVVMNENVNLVDYHYFNGSHKQLLRDLAIYLKKAGNADDHDYRSFVAVFSREKFNDELSFEEKFWEYMQQLSNFDPKPWSEEISDDPESKDFAFSLLETPFYLIGLHSNSSREARQFKHTAIVFNLHQQFEHMRSMGIYTSVRDKIRSRDIDLQGFINPMLEDFGEDSQAKQYSGRAVDDNWTCPFSNSKTYEINQSE